MSDEYIYDVDSIQERARMMTSTISELQELLTMIESLQSKVKSYGGWKGKQKQELLTFLELLIDYHKDLVKKSNAPFVQYQKALEELVKDLDSYTSQSKSYKELKNK